MSSQTARLWEAVLAALDSLAARADHSDEHMDLMPLYDNVYKSLGRVVCIPNATWKRLVQDIQVRDASQHMPAHSPRPPGIPAKL